MSDVTRAFEYVQKEISKLRAEQVEFLASGRSSSFDDYRHVCGVIRGLNHADMILKNLVQKMESDDE